MIPETKEAKSVRLYEWKDGKMVFLSTIIEDIIAVDTTLYLDNKTWWMFCYMQTNEKIKANELHLFSADDLLGEYKKHPLNPISTDCRNGRPAGSLFKYNGKLYRPAQNSSKGYGYGIRINEILVMNNEEYKESSVDEIMPLWSNKVSGIHTINYADNLTVVDIYGEF